MDSHSLPEKAQLVLLEDAAGRDRATARRVSLFKNLWNERFLTRTLLMVRVEGVLGQGCFGERSCIRSKPGSPIDPWAMPAGWPLGTQVPLQAVLTAAQPLVYVQNRNRRYVYIGKEDSQPGRNRIMEIRPVERAAHSSAAQSASTLPPGP